MIETICRQIAPSRSITFAIALVFVSPATATEFMFRADVDGKTLEGKPLNWSANNMVLLGRDGSLHEFDPRIAKNGEKTGSSFVGYSMPEMKRELYREYGKSLAITTTQHYIVVHPPGQHSAWADRCEELYRSCLRYFRVRGFTPSEPKFPLVAIVFRNQADYYKAASANGTPLRPGTLGHYDYTTNRVYLYDATNGNDRADWSDNAETIIHEATHQTAFNTGIHSRFAETPQWLVEGLATMFEARGVWNSQSFESRKDRVNVGRLRDFQNRVAKGGLPTSVGELVASDRIFRVDAAGAYAEAWALSFYLCETRPRQYVVYLAKTAARPAFRPYSAQDRVADFVEVFGSDFKKLEANFLAWMAEIK